MRSMTIEQFITQLKDIKPEKCRKGVGKARSYWNIACAYDSETSSISTTKVTTYAMMFSIDNKAEILVRDWYEFINVIELLKEKFKGATLPIYVHNLGFDFAGMADWLEWDEVFSTAPHRPIRARTGNIEFRDSAILLATTLEHATENMSTTKAVGELDYSLIRHSKTKLTEQEIDYCFRDVEALVEVIKYRMQDMDLAHIPMTNTGFVREYVRERMMKDHTAIKFVQSLTIQEEEYKMLKLALAAGYTHGNAFFTGDTVEDVDSNDRCSSYPAEAVCEYYPSSSGRKIEVESMDDFVYYLTYYLSVFPVTFYNIELRKGMGDCPLSYSRSWGLVECEEDNGRIYKAKEVTAVMTNIDFETIQKFYLFDSFDVKEMWIYEKERLPKTIVECILKFFNDKMLLKGVEGKEWEYDKSKGMLNSIIGMMITDIDQPSIKFKDGKWEEDPVENFISKYNNSKKRFLFYPWGLFCLAYARAELFEAIYEDGNDHVYSDTDSEKLVHYERHALWYKQYNENLARKMDDAMDYYELDRELTRPGGRQLGAFEHEYKAKHFKVLGAKRYLVRTDDDQMIFTVSGTPKATSMEYMLKTTKTKYTKHNGKIYIQDDDSAVFDMFDDDLVIPAQYTGKMSHTYIHKHQTFDVVDYEGETATVEERGGCYLEPVEYSLSMTEEYLKFALDIKEYRVHYYE